MEPFGFESGPSRAMSSFKAHEESYHRCSQAINRHINGLQLGRVDAIGAIQLPTEFDEADQHVKGMEIEVRTMKGAERRQCQSRANQCRADLKSLRKSVQQAGQRAQSDELMRRGTGVGGGGMTASGEWAAGGTGLGSLGPDLAQQSLARSRISLLDSRRVLEETEGIGRDVMGDLEAQRESFLRSNVNVRETEDAATKARRLLRSISRKEFRHRLFLYLVIFCLSTAIVSVVYLKIRRHLK